MSNEHIIKKLDNLVGRLDTVDQIIKDQEKQIKNQNKQIKELKKILASLYEELHKKKLKIEEYQEKYGNLDNSKNSES